MVLPSSGKTLALQTSRKVWSCGSQPREALAKSSRCGSDTDDRIHTQYYKNIHFTYFQDIKEIVSII